MGTLVPFWSLLFSFFGFSVLFVVPSLKKKVQRRKTKIQGRKKKNRQNKNSLGKRSHPSAASKNQGTHPHITPMRTHRHTVTHFSHEKPFYIQVLNLSSLVCFLKK